MTISAIIVADSISPDGIRITTMQLRYPRFIHAELMTHRVFSRNASSSRAIPVARMIEDLRRDPAIPIHWGSNKPGMQAGDELCFGSVNHCKTVWLNAMNNAIHSVESLVDAGLHKQVANRILEPWAHINTLVTSTDWANFYALRAHKDAQPEIHELALAMFQAQQESTPEKLRPGEWHLPYVPKDEIYTAMVHDKLDSLKMVSTARCARVSYLTHEGKVSTIEEDLSLYNKLITADLIHASPAEHQATPDRRTSLADDGYHYSEWVSPEMHGNFTGWIQHRKLLPNECIH